MTNTPEGMNEALDAIHDEALKLLQHATSDEIAEGLELIVSLARYKFDVRAEAEKNKIVHKMTVAPSGVILGQHLKGEPAPIVDGTKNYIFVKAIGGKNYVGQNINQFSQRDREMLTSETF